MSVIATRVWRVWECFLRGQTTQPYNYSLWAKVLILYWIVWVFNNVQIDRLMHRLLKRCFILEMGTWITKAGIKIGNKRHSLLHATHKHLDTTGSLFTNSLHIDFIPKANKKAHVLGLNKILTCYFIRRSLGRFAFNTFMLSDFNRTFLIKLRF